LKRRIEERYAQANCDKEAIIQKGAHQMQRTLLLFVILGSAVFGITGAATAGPAGGSLLGAAKGQIRSSGEYVDLRRYERRHGRRVRRHVYGYRAIPDPDLRWGQWRAWHRNWY
jgi:hypothetical protein